MADDAVELTQALVALDTVNPALVPGAPGERAAVELLAARLGAQGFEIEIVGPAERPSLLATHRGRAAAGRWRSTGTSTPSTSTGWPIRSRRGSRETGCTAAARAT